MTENNNTKNEPWRNGAPDYMVAAIDSIIEARDEIRATNAALAARALDLTHREQILSDERAAFVKAAADMRDFADRLFGPESELAKINRKLDDSALADRVRNIESDVVAIKKEIVTIGNRISSLESQKSA